MKHYEKKTITQEYNTVVKTTCDLCGTIEGSKDWLQEHYDYNDVTVSHEHGSRFPEGGHGEELKLDICPKCFTSKVLPFLENLAKDKLEYKEIDW
jgi:hypothetical protein